MDEKFEPGFLQQTVSSEPCRTVHLCSSLPPNCQLDQKGSPPGTGGRRHTAEGTVYIRAMRGIDPG
jgi:hypothetical protein